MGEVVITLPLPPGVRSRALSCTFKRTQLCATLKGAAEPLLNVEVLPTHPLPHLAHLSHLTRLSYLVIAHTGAAERRSARWMRLDVARRDTTALAREAGAPQCAAWCTVLGAPHRAPYSARHIHHIQHYYHPI